MRFLTRLDKCSLRLRPRYGLLLPAALLIGCGPENIRVYQVPREKPTPTTAHSHVHETGSAQNPHGTPSEIPAWNSVPDGWEEQPNSGMRAGSFAINGPDAQKAEVAIMSLNRMGGSDLQLVNLWRSSMGLTPVDETRLPDMVEEIPIGEDTGKFFDVVDQPENLPGDDKNSIFVALVVRGETSWFFKLAGHAELVAAQKEPFKSFLKSVRFQPAQPPVVPPVQTAASPQSTAGSPAKPAWNVPGHWQEVPPSAMLLAKFLLAGESKASAEVTVSVFPGDVGGLLANVNRWRGQVGQPAMTEPDLANAVTPLATDAGQATIVDVTGTNPTTEQPVRLIGAILPRGGQTWFFKLMGDAALAGQEKAAFLKFIQSVRYPNA